MSDADDFKESFVEDESKVIIEATSVNLYCVKNEPSEEALDFEDSHTTQYRITLEYENIFGKPSNQRNIKGDSDNLIGFMDNDVIMENAKIKLETIKEEEEGSVNNSHCKKCKEIYKGFCLKCSTLSCILNNNLTFVKSELNTTPVDILEIRETSRGKGVYLLRTLPVNIIFGPFEGVLRIESIVGYCWKIIDNKLENIKNGNWMKNIACATSTSLKNLDIFQIDGNLYFQSNKEITEGEELLIYYDDEELRQLDNSEECLYTPQKQQKLPKIFACTLCCLGFGSNQCLIEHKRKCCQMEHSRSMKDFVLIECHYCKMLLEKWEHDQYHVAYCLEKQQRMWSDYSEAVDRSDRYVEEIKDDFGTKDGKRTYQHDICSKPWDRRDSLQFDAKDDQCFSGENHETRTNNEQIQNTIEANNKNHFQNHRIKHTGIKLFKCDICMRNFTQKGHLATHIKNKHIDDGSAKDYNCLECSYQTNYKTDFQRHLNKHRGIKPFKCDFCMKKFGLKAQLKMHIKNKHTDDGTVKDYNCLECSFQTNYRTNFQMHLNKHSGIKQFQCDVCMVKFTQKGTLKRHIKDKHADNQNGKDHKCSECPYQTNQKANLEKHLNKHSAIKEFQCDICMKKFSQKRYLASHIENTHRGIKQFECDICMKKFGQKIHLTMHIKNQHTDGGTAKDYKCLECTFQTNYKANFQMHLNKHRGIKYQCYICMMKFTQKGNLNTHIKNKHTNDESSKDYKCSECCYQTNYKGYLQKHVKVHSDIKPFQCDSCLKKFRQRAHLKTHVRTKHTDDATAKDF